MLGIGCQSRLLTCLCIRLVFIMSNKAIGRYIFASAWRWTRQPLCVNLESLCARPALLEYPQQQTQLRRPTACSARLDAQPTLETFRTPGRCFHLIPHGKKLLVSESWMRKNSSSSRCKTCSMKTHFFFFFFSLFESLQAVSLLRLRGLFSHFNSTHSSTGREKQSDGRAAMCFPTYCRGSIPKCCVQASG